MVCRQKVSLATTFKNSFLNSPPVLLLTSLKCLLLVEHLFYSVGQQKEVQSEKSGPITQTCVQRAATPPDGASAHRLGQRGEAKLVRASDSTRPGGPHPT